MKEGVYMIDMVKNVTPDFQKDLADILEICLNNHTNTITISLDYGEYQLETELTFRLFKNGESILKDESI